MERTHRSREIPAQGQREDTQKQEFSTGTWREHRNRESPACGHGENPQKQWMFITETWREHIEMGRVQHKNMDIYIKRGRFQHRNMDIEHRETKSPAQQKRETTKKLGEFSRRTEREQRETGRAQHRDMERTL